LQIVLGIAVLASTGSSHIEEIDDEYNDEVGKVTNKGSQAEVRCMIYILV